PLYGDGMNVRDWCYVVDNCAGVDTVLRNGDVGEIYNIGADNEIPNKEITARLIELTGRDTSAIEWVEDRLGHDRRYSIDTSKIEALGWRPQHEFADALALTVDWYRNNRWWWEPLKR
ncbi:MAG: GDP-mannose 4,6-dehydratase, partial [Acidimicrobiia bacterium]|nr:GDP-mannose 4,6-dehydratase [Acidimicrobiia bacterium]